MQMSDAPGSQPGLLQRLAEHGLNAPPATRYTIALALNVGAALVRIALDPIWGDRYPFAFYFLTTLVSGLYGGFGPAITGMGVSVVMTVIWVLPPLGQFSPRPAPLSALAAFVVIDIGLAWIAARFRDLLHERQQWTLAVDRQRAELRAITDITPVMLARCSRDLRYLYANRAYAEMVGTTPDHIVGQPIESIVGARGFATIRPHIEQVLRGEPVEYEDDVHFESTNKSHWLRVTFMPDRDLYGRVIGWVASMADITDRRRAEQREHELRQAAEEANRIKDEFLAIVSHELRNPLNVMLGYSELLSRTEDVARAPQLQRIVETIKRNAAAQSQLIRDLLDLSRLRGGKIELHQDCVSMAAVVQHAVDSARPDAGGKGVTITVREADHTAFVDGDAVRLEQVVWNLLSNSIKFTPPGGTISIRVRKAGTHVELEVSDTGRGINPAFLPHVFELFRQADAGLGRAQSGLGIGLAVVQQLVSLHHGSVRVHSEGQDQGAVFTVTLPLSPRSGSVPMSAPAEMPALDGLRVLIVDDSEDTTDMLADALTRSGAVVSTATNGHDALMLAAAERFDVVLSDLAMPMMDGFEFLRRLRELPRDRHATALALTGFGRAEDIDRVRAAGFAHHLTKPVDLDALLAILRSQALKRTPA
jgi:PAS domain S-box-containing protein